MSGQEVTEKDQGPHDISLPQWISCAPFENLLGITIVEAKGGTARLTLPFTRQLAQGFGLMHGGALVTLADTAVVMAIKSLLPANSRFATTKLQANYLSPVTKGTVTATATITHREDRTLFGNCEVTSNDGTPVLSCSCHFRIAREVPAECIQDLPLAPEPTLGEQE